MDIRRIWLCKDVVLAEGGLRAVTPVTRAAACAVIANPLAGRPGDDLAELVAFGADLGERLVKEAQALLFNPAIAYGKAAIVGTAGDIEHAAAILHPRMGKPMRDAIGGGEAIIPSNVKIGGVGASIDIPLGHKDDVWSFDQIDTLSVMVPNAPRPDEIVVIVVLADGGRPRPRVARSGAVPPRGAT
ncbi:MAG: amino acid synthesis family protein [Alphaproteobacteria bacterium]|nr:amino acid synthesis family protein [Alphaproteobacteria bacterium]